MIEDKNIDTAANINIQNLIYTFRGKQVMIDRDLAGLYKVQTKRLNEQVKRNIDRFPIEFCFKLNDEEKNELVANCDRFEKLKHSTSNPYAFTEQGIAMLSAVLKSDIAIKVSIKIINSFIEMRKILFSNKEMFARLDRLELKQLETDKRLEEAFNYISNNTEVKQNIFFNGQIYDAFSLISNLIRKATTDIILIDGYTDTGTLDFLSKKLKNTSIYLHTTQRGCQLTTTEINRFNKQYPRLYLTYTNAFHDRFLIIDHNLGYHIGASIKDAGKKCFAITLLEDQKLIQSIIDRL